MKTKRLKGLVCLAVSLFIIGLTLCLSHQAMAQKGGQKGGVSPVPPKFEVDPFWPKSLPAPDGHQWVITEPGASCIDSQDHVITVNRGNLTTYDAIDTALPAPPVTEFDPEGNLVNAWGDRAILPEGLHNCFVDQQDNIWIGGMTDAIVQKWSHDGTTLLLQIGTKGLFDTSDGTIEGTPLNSSHTLLNRPNDIAIDPGNGDIYISDGYGNYRVVVFDKNGNFLRQWGSGPGTGPGEFGTSGHPHCIVLPNNGLVYACDRANHRIEVFDKEGTWLRDIRVDPPPPLDQSRLRATDIAFSPDRDQTWMYVTDLGSDKVWIMNHELGTIVYGLGLAGHLAGEFNFPHTLTVDSKGNLYVAETFGGRRIQKFKFLGHSPVSGP